MEFKLEFERLYVKDEVNKAAFQSSDFVHVTVPPNTTIGYNVNISHFYCNIGQ